MQAPQRMQFFESLKIIINKPGDLLLNITMDQQVFTIKILFHGKTLFPEESFCGLDCIQFFWWSC